MKQGDDKVDKWLASGNKVINGWNVGSFFGDEAFYNGDWLMRAGAAKGGIYGNDAVEAMYPYTRSDETGEALDASKHNYTMTFLPGQLPSRQCLWVRYNVRRQEPALGQKPDQSLPRQLSNVGGDEKRPGRLADTIPSKKRKPRRG